MAGFRTHEPQESVISRNGANERGLRFGSVEPPSDRPPHSDHLFNKVSLA